MKMYLNESACISPEHTFEEGFLRGERVTQTTQNVNAVEPEYKPFIPLNSLRRMGKTSRMGIATGLKVYQESNIEFDAIINGSTYGSNAESFKFLDQIFKFDEGAMTPTNFVQSTTNIVASQLALMTNNYNYNSTNSSKAHSFENCLHEASMLLKNELANNVLVGAVDEISVYTYHLFSILKWVREDAVTPKNAILNKGFGFVSGEGAAFFHLSKLPVSKDSVEISYFKTFSNVNSSDLKSALKKLPFQPDLILSPKNGDNDTDEFIDSFMSDLKDIPSINFKKYFGEFPTVSGLSVWLGQKILQKGLTELDEVKWNKIPKHILIVNHFVTHQTSFILLSCQ